MGLYMAQCVCAGQRATPSTIVPGIGTQVTRLGGKHLNPPRLSAALYNAIYQLKINYLYILTYQPSHFYLTF